MDLLPYGVMGVQQGLTGGNQYIRKGWVNAVRVVECFCVTEHENPGKQLERLILKYSVSQQAAALQSNDSIGGLSPPCKGQGQYYSPTTA